MTQEQLSLDSLDETYQVVAELRTQGDSRAFLGTRRSDGLGVLIRVARPPKDDAKNALTHYAADANLLRTLQHRSLLPVLEGRWLDPQTFATITERTTLPSLEEMLVRGEELSPTRVAAILQEIASLLSWARERGVVHRTVTPSSLFVDPASDRICASFVVRPLPITGVPGPEADGRTIASLAWTMLTGRTEGPEDAEESLDDLRPDLPARLVNETTALLRADANAEKMPDVRDYVALIAMVDALRIGEDETARIRTKLLQEQRATREELDAARRALEEERAEHEGRVATEREEHERRVAADKAEHERQIAAEREEMQRVLERNEHELAAKRSELAREIADRRRELARDRSRLQQEYTSENDQLMSDRAQLESVRAEIEEQLAVLAAQRTEIEAQRAELSRLRESLDEARESVEREVAVDAALGEPHVVEDAGSEERPTPPDDVEIPQPVEIEVASPVDVPLREPAVAPVEIERTQEPTYRSVSSTRRTRTRAALASLVGLAIVVSGTAYGIARHRSSSAAATDPAAALSAPAAIVPPALARRTPPSAPIVDSSAGNVAPAITTPTAVVDSVPVVDSAAIKAAAAARRRRRLQRIADSTRIADSVARVRIDSLSNASPVPNIDNAFRIDSATRLRATAPRRDSSSGGRPPSAAADSAARVRAIKPRPDTSRPDSVRLR